MNDEAAIEGLRGTIAELTDEVALLKVALQRAILERSRVARRTVEVDPAGNTYEIDWMPRVREWARLCDLDLDRHLPSYYDDGWR